MYSVTRLSAGNLSKTAHFSCSGRGSRGPTIRHLAHKLRSYGDQLFEPLPQWVNETLAPAVAIALFEYDGITQAKLVTSPEDSAKATRTIALR